MNRTADDRPITLIRFRFTLRHLEQLRRFVGWAARRVNLDSQRVYGLVLAVNEAASNVIRHGGGSGQLELIRDDNRALVAEVSDHGPGMATRAQLTVPPAGQIGGRGLYLIQQICDHVVCRSGPAGTTIRMEMRLSRG